MNKNQKQLNDLRMQNRKNNLIESSSDSEDFPKYYCISSNLCDKFPVETKFYEKSIKKENLFISKETLTPQSTKNRSKLENESEKYEDICNIMIILTWNWVNGYLIKIQILNKHLKIIAF